MVLFQICLVHQNLVFRIHLKCPFIPYFTCSSLAHYYWFYFICVCCSHRLSPMSVLFSSNTSRIMFQKRCSTQMSSSQNSQRVQGILDTNSRSLLHIHLHVSSTEYIQPVLRMPLLLSLIMIGSWSSTWNIPLVVKVLERVNTWTKKAVDGFFILSLSGSIHHVIAGWGVQKLVCWKTQTHFNWKRCYTEREAIVVLASFFKNTLNVIF